MKSVEVEVVVRREVEIPTNLGVESLSSES
jgi:hypothetical protein